MIVNRCTQKSCGLLFGYIDLLSSEASTIRKLILTESEYLKLQRVDFIGLINKSAATKGLPEDRIV